MIAALFGLLFFLLRNLLLRELLFAFQQGYSTFRKITSRRKNVLCSTFSVSKSETCIRSMPLAGG